MEQMDRRSFCGASLMTLPLMNVVAIENGVGNFLGETDPVLDALVDEFSRTTQDGTRNGFSAAHFRQYAGQVRIFNAHLDAKGMGKSLNKKLDDNDYYFLNPDSTVRLTLEYWKKRGILLNESDLTDQVAVDEYSYGMVKKSIKKLGGIHKLNEKIAEALERKAENYASAAYQSRLTIQDDSIRLPALHRPGCNSNFKNVQYEDIDILDPHLFIGLDLNCLCKAMIVEGALLSIGCVTVCQPCCVPAAIMLGFATLMEELEFCDSDKC